MPLLRCLATIDMDSGNPDDTVSNTWWFISTGTRSTDTADIIVALDTFYGSIDQVFSKFCATNGLRYRFYDMSEPEPRVAYSDSYRTFTPATTDALPPELCIVGTFQADPVSGGNQRSRRGRLYFGPLDAGNLDASTGLWANSRVTLVSNALGVLRDASSAATDWNWVVHSPTYLTDVTVQSGWVDNAPDIQRRRGVEATFRDTF